MKKQPYNGARLNQTPEEEGKNFKQSEVVATVAPVVWVDKTPDQFLKYPIRKQDGSGRCVVFTYAKELSIIFQQKYGVWIDFSTCFPYQLRSEPTISGCSSKDIYDVFPKIGNIFEQFMPGDNLNDANSMAVKMPPYAKDLAKTIEPKRIWLPIDFDTVASTIQQTGKGVMVWFHFSSYEWLDIPIVTDHVLTSGHSITAIEAVRYNGKEYLVCDESWGLDQSMNGQRLISREYFNARCYQASYLLNFDLTPQKLIERPHFDGSIVSLQNCLKWEGLFPNNVDSVESFGNISRMATKAFQIRYGITPALGNFGDITRAKLTLLYP